MQHLDEARLHEYLDRSGESDPVLREIETHLASCASCRTRLDEVSALRASASDILRAASPEKRPVPSFEEVAALMGAPIAASSTATAVRRNRNRTYELAWAATVVLALGAGWMAHAVYRSSDAGPGATESVRQAAAPQSDAVLQATSPAPSPPVVETPSESSMSPQVEVATADAVAPRSADAAGAAGTGAARGVTGGAANAAPGASDLSAMSREQTRREAAPLSELAAAPPAPPPPAAAAAAAPSQSAKAAVSEFAVRTASADTVSVNVLLQTTQWRTVSGESALAALGGSLVHARGLAILDYAVARDNERRVRVRQVTAAGDTVDVLQMLPLLVSSRALAPSQSRPQIPEAMLDARMYQSIARGAARSRVYNATQWLDNRIVVFASAREEALTNLEPELVRTTGGTR